MAVAKSILKRFVDEPSVFALLVDNISKMSRSEQKVLWMRLNEEKILAVAREIDAGSPSNNLTESEINTLVKEARAYANKEKKS